MGRGRLLAPGPGDHAAGPPGELIDLAFGGHLHAPLHQGAVAPPGVVEDLHRQVMGAEHLDDGIGHLVGHFGDGPGGQQGHGSVEDALHGRRPLGQRGREAHVADGESGGAGDETDQLDELGRNRPAVAVVGDE